MKARNGTAQKWVSWFFICIGILFSVLHALFDTYALWIASKQYNAQEYTLADKQMWLSHIILFSAATILLLALAFFWFKKKPESNLKQNLLCLASIAISLLIAFFAIAFFF